MLLYNRKKSRYRKDGYCWKKRRDGKTTREDHMKLKVQGVECIYGCYVHSAILPTFHRRCYWLLQVRYLPFTGSTRPSIKTDNAATKLPTSVLPLPCNNCVASYVTYHLFFTDFCKNNCTLC